MKSTPHWHRIFALILCFGAALATTVSARADARELPKLDISWDCGECMTNPKIIPLIQQKYLTLARSNGWSVSKKVSAKASITDFRQRPPGVRALVGFIAGKDRLALYVQYRKNEFSVEDHDTVGFHGMNDLCARIAEKLYRRITEIR